MNRTAVAYFRVSTKRQGRSGLGRVDGFDEDEAQSKRDERAVVLVRFLAA
jgi:hypothetical protein